MLLGEKLFRHRLASKVMKIITVKAKYYRRSLLNPRTLFLTLELFRRSQRDFASNNNCITVRVAVVMVAVRGGEGRVRNNKNTSEFFLLHSAKSEKKKQTHARRTSGAFYSVWRERKKKPGQRLEILSLVFDLMCSDTVFYCDGPINCRTNSCKTRY